MLSQESWKEKGLGKGTNTYLGEVNRGNGSRGEFLWDCTVFVDSQQKSRLFYLPDVATNNSSRETVYKIFN